MPKHPARIIGLAAVALLIAPWLAYPTAIAAPRVPKPQYQSLTVPSTARLDLPERDTYTVTVFEAVWPVDTGDTRISDGFGARTAPTAGASTFHEGVDFTPDRGAVIHAVAAGTVIEAGRNSGLGWHVIVQHIIDGQSVQTVYGHMIRRPVVRVGDPVVMGQQLGNVGSTGVSTGPHLHFELHIGGVPVDPLPWLRAHAPDERSP